MYTLVSPWPPQRNGIADYAHAIARWTPHPLRIVTETLRPMQTGHWTIQGPDTPFPDLPSVYHFGNNPDHAFMPELFLRHPGIVVLHDLSLHGLVERADALLPGFFAAQLRAERPALAPALERVWAEPGQKRLLDWREVKLLRWLEAAPCIVVHSRHAAALAHDALPGRPVHVLPHFCYPAPMSCEALQARRPGLRARWLGMEEAEARSAVLVSALGFPARQKQVGAVLRAIATMEQSRRERIVLLVSAAPEPNELPVAIAPALAGRVRPLGYLPAEILADVLLASDLVFVLRYPSWGESSGMLARGLGLGCALAVTDTGAYAELPDEVCVKLPARSDPVSAIRTLLETLLDDPATLNAHRAAAYGFARTVGDPARAAARYSELALA